MAQQIASLKTIEAALKLIDPKKEGLKRAFDDLQSHSSLLSSFSLSWPDLDSHFSSLQTNLTDRFHHLQSLESSSSPRNHDTHESNTPNQSPAIADFHPSSTSNPLEEALSVSNRPELVSLCEKMDGQGLRNYISDHAKEREAIRVELLGLMAVAPDPGTMVLDALEGFYSSSLKHKGDKDTDLYRLRKSCLDLLEVLTEIKPSYRNEVKERAIKLALDWKEKVSLNGDRDSPLEALGFLNLLVAYGVKNAFEMDDLLDYFVVIARFKQSTVLCRAIGLGDKTADLVQKLIENGKHPFAVKFIFEFELTDKFPPVPILKDHVKECKDLGKKVGEEGKNSIKAQNEAKSRELNALKSVIKIIDEYKLESEYPRLDLEKQIEMLEKKADKKVTALSPDDGPQQQPKKQVHQQQPKKQQAKKQQVNGNKRPRTTAMIGPAAAGPISIAGSSSTIPPFQQSHLPPSQQSHLPPSQQSHLPPPALLPAAGPYGLVGSTPSVATYTGSSAGPYGLVGSTPSVATYTGSSAGPYGLVGFAPPIATYAGSSAGSYGLAGAAMGPTPGMPNPYSLDPYTSSSYYDRPAAYGGYGLPPHYHPGYYPH